MNTSLLQAKKEGSSRLESEHSKTGIQIIEKKIVIEKTDNDAKRLENIVKALESNNLKLVEEVARLKSQLSTRNHDRNNESGDTQKWDQKYRTLRNKVLDLQSEKFELEQKVKELSEANRDQ